MNKLIINYVADSKKRTSSIKKEYQVIVGLTSNKTISRKFMRLSKKRLTSMLLSLNPGLVKGHIKFENVYPSLVYIPDEVAGDFNGFVIL